MSLLRSNLLKKALKLIPGESYQYLKYIDEEVNEMGIAVAQHAEPQIITGSVQSPENSLYEQMGLNLDRNYKIFYGAVDIKGNEAQPQPDKFIYNGKTYETVKNSDWFNYDGWCGVLAVEVKKDRKNDD